MSSPHAVNDTRNAADPHSEVYARALHAEVPDFDGARGLAGMLFFSVLAALLVAGVQLMDTWANGHWLAVWVLLWTIAFSALALFAPLLRPWASTWVARISRRADKP